MGADTVSAVFTVSAGPLVGLDPLGVYSYTLDVEAVPEPASLALLGMGLAGLGLRRRSRG